MSEVYLELQRNGAYLKCTATDSVSGEEAIAIGPVNDPESVKKLAVQKLRNRLLAKKDNRLDRGDTGSNTMDIKV